MDEQTAFAVSRALSHILAKIDPVSRRDLEDEGHIDTLLALKTAVQNAPR